ncbi:PAS domain S-box-containing protein/diguanylate cyclase (GGDEF)-like protein [Thiogranum longum]|uniref:PAS domain S-box-containing protein/diguanylate cyclase (GGDEF)-like protein n=2 Tax=Thiogranum longum TaxID=1537524 RepID=A0A4R1HE12_9GAMM|nr:PAS domain S-box-containing protein/diguanylate cyclase (GGDEF)-like protein [Thiogranum longum]
MKNLNIQSKVLLVTLLPLMITGFLLSSFFIWSQISGISTALDRKGQSIANLLSSAAEYGVLSGNEVALTKLIYASAHDPDIMAIVVSDKQDQPIVHTHPSGWADLEKVIQSGNDRLYKIFTTPVFYSSLPVDDYEPDASVGGTPGAATDLIGYVHVIVDRKHAIAQQTDVLVNGLLITAIAILITAYFASLMARSVTSPIRSLTSITDAISKGELEKRIAVDTGGEIGILQKSINSMATALEQARNKETERATDALFIEKVKAQTTLESLGEGVITTDASGIITYLNPAAEKLTGWTFSSACRRPLHEVFKVVSSNTRVPIDYPVYDCINGGNTIHHDFLLTLTRHDGKEFIIQDTATPIRDNYEDIIGMVLVFHDFSKLHRMSERLAYQASHDDLTGLLNRREFEAQLSRALIEVNDEATEHALCYIDLDQFKIVNDTCGHKAGDELLKQLTVEIRKKIRNHDVFARLGGDEFGIILKDCPMSNAEKLAAHIKDAASTFRFSWQQHTFEIGASIGLVPITHGHATTSDLMMTADSACYIAKDKGRNRIHIYEPTDEDIIQRSGDMQWLQTLNKSIDNDKLVLYSQLITPISETQGLGQHYEILLRMKGIEGDIVQPGLFIPAAERYHLMTSIDRWVVRNTFLTLAKAGLSGIKADLDVPGFSLNLSAQSLTENSFLDYVVEQFEDSGINPSLITFEITETAAIANLARATEVIEKLKQLGSRFSLDDFGSGLSSFAYLSNLPVDNIKIDGHFVRDIADNPVSRSIVESVAQIGRVMGVKTIAEFVENDYILQEAKDCGIDYVQGYGIERPRPLKDILKHLGLTRMT